MYETYFGLNKRPFRALAAGTDVFVGPQTAATMAALKKALTAADTIAAVSGPVGSGKTTLVRRALDAVGDSQLIISVGRMQLGHDEVLELLLEEMGAELPTGTVQRFTTFRRLLKEKADKGTRVFVVVEDAARVGADALSELEALTASDAGVSEGANIVLMGDQDMNEVLNEPQLARLRQRLRLRQAISPLSANELTGYFKHCFRLAGNEFDRLFEPGTANVLHALSGGIPRMANNLVESALTSAADSKQDRIGVALIKLIATEEYGLEAGQEAPVVSSPVASVEPIQVADAPDEPEVPEVPTLSNSPAPADKPEVEVVAAETPIDSEDEDDAIPELIQDTLPDLEILAPNLATAADVENTEVPDWERDPTLAQLRPDLDALEHAMAVAQGLEPDTDEDEDDPKIPDEPPERVPEITLDREIQAKIDEAAELLKQAEREAAEEEEAAAEASNEAPKATPPPSIHVKAPLAPKPVAKVEPTPARIPVVQPEAPPAPKAAAQVEPAPTPKPTVKVAPPPAPKPVTKVEPTPARIPVVQPEAPPAPIPAAQVEPPSAPKAPPVPEPVVQAETTPEPAPIPVVQPEPEPEVVFEPQPAAKAPEPAPVVDEAPQEDAEKPDSELEKIAVNIARAKTIDDCDDKMAETLFGEEFSMMAAQVAANAPPELSANDELELAQEESAAASIPDFEGAAALNVELESQAGEPRGKLDEASSQRLATVRALNGSSHLPATATEPVSTAISEPTPPPVAKHPESIEEQINTSMTQTLNALNVRPPTDDDDEPKGGFFSRFRRS